VVQRTRLLSDNGACFISHELKKYLETHEIRHVRTKERRNAATVYILKYDELVVPVLIRLRALEESLCQIDRFVEVVIVHVADVDVDFSPQVRPQRLPIAFEDVAKIIFLLPGLCDLAVDFPG